MLLFLCCNPALTPPAQVALTLRAVGRLCTAEIPRGLSGMTHWDAVTTANGLALGRENDRGRRDLVACRAETSKKGE